jgi:hypothetical protein
LKDVMKNYMIWQLVRMKLLLHSGTSNKATFIDSYLRSLSAVETT